MNVHSVMREQNPRSHAAISTKAIRAIAKFPSRVTDMTMNNALITLSMKRRRQPAIIDEPVSYSLIGVSTARQDLVSRDFVTNQIRLTQVIRHALQSVLMA